MTTPVVRTSNVRVKTVEVAERPGWLTHSLRIRASGDQRSKKSRRATTVTACCDHRDAERVLCALGDDDGFEWGPRCHWTAGVLEDLLRQGVALDRALPWAALPVQPIRPHWMYQWKVRTRPWNLCDLDGWLARGIRPEVVALSLATHPHKSPGYNL